MKNNTPSAEDEFSRGTFSYCVEVAKNALGVILGTSFMGLPFMLYYLVFYLLGFTGAGDILRNVISCCVPLFILCCVGGGFAVEANMSKAELVAERRTDEITRSCIALRKEYEKWKRAYDTLYSDLCKLENDKKQNSPWMAQQYADFIYTHTDIKLADHLINKSHPAKTAAEQVKKIAEEKRALQRMCKMYEYQCQYYETLFPWLEEFRELPADDGARYALKSRNDRDYDYARDWLSPAEYQALPSAEKSQKALERYNRRKKTDWEAGIEFERYVGYLYERQDYQVTYTGATQGLDDRGRDLVARRKGETLIIQCKRWAKEKTIHEKHIFQLYGTTILNNVQTGEDAVGVFVSTTELSDLARRCAEHLGIQVIENMDMEAHPMIKCNVSKTGEKIYHLPFDQQYDKIQISGKRGAKYVATAYEAEELGFRRAYRWNPERE